MSNYQELKSIFDIIEKMLPFDWDEEKATDCYAILYACQDSDGRDIEEPQMIIPYDDELKNRVLQIFYQTNPKLYHEKNCYARRWTRDF